MLNKISMREFTPKQTDVILLDTNLIIDLFYPMNFGKNVADATDIYKKIVKSGAKIIMSAIQISEFVNRCIRFQFDLYKSEHPECVSFKKDYRGTEDYTNCMNAIIEIINNEWKNIITYVDDKFTELPLEKILKYNFSYDFNDAIIVEIANKYNAIIVTNDTDIINYDVKSKVVTSSTFLLSIR
ncbi:MAG: PIN domain-containing protein [Lachnospiraceae bacterium]|nr:PIN domain-containing protein [Lachnospiraceae bacterium]